MLFEGTRDFRNAFAGYGFLGYENVLKKAANNEIKRYLPVYENVELNILIFYFHKDKIIIF
jgi:hypothetical protein